MELSRSALEAAPKHLLNRGRLGNPVVWLVEMPRGPVVWKDFAPRPSWLRATLGRVAISREARAYSRLGGHPGVPRLLGRVDAVSLVVEYRAGRPLSRRVRRNLHKKFWDRLDRSIDAMHERGVVHLDLRHRSNVLVDADEQPILIDFGSALCLRPGSFALRSLARIDRSAVRKWRERHEGLHPAA